MLRHTSDTPNQVQGVVLPDYRPSSAPPALPGASVLWVIGVAVAIITAVGAVIACYPLYVMGRGLAEALAEEGAAFAVLARLLLAVSGGALIFSAAGLARLLWRLADRASVVRLPGDAPVLISDLRRHGAALAAQSLEAHYATQQVWAERSQWRGVGAYSPHITYRTEGAPPAALEAPALEGPPVAPPVDLARPVLRQLADKGLLRSDSLLVGFAGSEPARIDLALAGAIAIAGQSRSGKTTTALGLLAQAAYGGSDILLCDPHGLHPEGLLGKGAALSGCFAKQAITDAEIAHLCQLTAKIARRRLQGLDPADRPLILVLDEFTGLTARAALPGEVLSDLLSLAVESAKVKVHTVLIAQDWAARLLGQWGAPLRRAVTYRIVHRTAPEGAAFLLPGAADARKAASLTRGEAILWPADGSPVTITVPLMATPDDLHFASRGAPPKPYVPRPTLPAPAAPTPTLAAPPAPGPTIGAKVKTLLADGQPRDSAAVAAALSLSPSEVQPALTRLAQAGEIAREGSQRAYRYRRA